MPDIDKTQIGNGAVAVTETVLDGATDALSYRSSDRPILVLRNPTAGPLSPVIVGDAATTVNVGGVGQLDVSGGYEVGAIAAGAVVAIPLNSIKQYLAGVISITGGAGLVAVLLAD